MAAFGIDFGTSNSAVAMASDEGEIRLVDWPVPEVLTGAIALELAKPQRSSTLPTVLFAPEYEPGLLVGHEAIARYLFAGFEGRFIQSIKAFLPQASFTGTAIRGRHLSIEEIVAAYLKRLKSGAEEQLGQSIEGRIVFGRPARFSAEPEADRLAETRLKKAIALAGFPEVEMLIEPVAAALAYEATLKADETVLVVDLGGGTSDFTLMRVGPSHRGQRDRAKSILASGGLSVAGDAFDGEIVRARLFDVFGQGASYRSFGGASTPLPHWIFQKLKRWNHVSFLKSKKYLDFLKEVHPTCDKAEAIGRLIRVIDEDMGFLMFRAVERAKRGVHAGKGRIVDADNDLPVDATMSQEEFEGAVCGLIEEIEATALDVLAEAKVERTKVDAVFMTGGTSLIPEVRATFAGLFGAEKLRTQSTFTSVVDGLARAAL